MRTLLYLLDKEFRQFFRDPFMPRMVLIFPVMIMLIFPFATNMDFKNINICIVDNDNSNLSRQIANKIDHSSYFILKKMPSGYQQALSDMNRYGLDIILEIPENFEKSIFRNESIELSITANAVNASKAATGSNYLAQILSSTFAEQSALKGLENPQSLITVRNLYNPTENYRYFMIPALMVMLIIIVCGALPALNIVKEKEAGTIEQINVSPIGKITFTFGKLIPYWIIGIFILSIALVIAKIMYGLSPAGALWIIYANAFLFTLVISSFGLIVSNFSNTMQQAMFIMFFFIMIFVLMSGLLTPISSMPEWAQYITAFIPPRYFIEIMRAVYLKGSGISDIYPEFVRLAGITVLLAVAAVASYKKQS